MSDEAFEKWAADEQLDPDEFDAARRSWQAAKAHMRKLNPRCGHLMADLIPVRVSTCSDHETDPGGLGQCGEVIEHCVDCGWEDRCLTCETVAKAREKFETDLHRIGPCCSHPARCHGKGTGVDGKPHFCDVCDAIAKAREDALVELAKRRCGRCHNGEVPYPAGDWGIYCHPDSQALLHECDADEIHRLREQGATAPNGGDPR